MNILMIADVYGNIKTLSKIITTQKNTDVVVCPGNFTDMFSVGKEFPQIDIADMVVQKLLIQGKPTLCVPGNHDPFEILDIFKEYNTNLHGVVRRIHAIDFLGFGGAPTPFNTRFEPGEEETKETLETLVKKITHPFILITHNPPKNTKLDVVVSGQHVGSQAIREFILTHKPILALSAHIPEAAGQDKLGETVLFNPGPAYRGRYGVVTVDNKNIQCVSHHVQI